MASSGAPAAAASRLILSALLEILFSAFFAPIMMVIQSGSVFQILVGRDTGWNPQRRDDGSIPFKGIVRRHRMHTLLGLVAGLSAFMIATSLFAWMSPTIVGLVLAIPLSWASGNLALGLWLKRRGLLITPEEGDPPAIALRANTLQAEFAQAGHDDSDGLAALHARPDAARDS
jgi:membrane glycosyltransferase